jgi:hypothetical protein
MAFFFGRGNLGWGMVPQSKSKARKTLKLKEHLQRELHLAPSKGTSGNMAYYLKQKKFQNEKLF